jgi:transposase
MRFARSPAIGGDAGHHNGEVVSMTLKHEGNNVREFYSKLPRPVRVGIEATGSMQWFVNLMEELGIECLSVIRPRFGPPSHGSRNMIGEMRT